MKEYKKFTLTTNNFYKDINGIEFTPIEDIGAIRKHKKGDIRKVKILGLSFKKTYKKDFYLYENRLSTFEEILDKFWSNELFTKNGKIYRKAIVEIKHEKMINNRHHFMTNEEAIEFINDIKVKCKEAQNELK